MRSVVSNACMRSARLGVGQHVENNSGSRVRMLSMIQPSLTLALDHWAQVPGSPSAKTPGWLMPGNSLNAVRDGEVAGKDRAGQRALSDLY